VSKNFVRVFQRKDHGKSFPRIGTTASIQPGDYLTFFLSGAYHTREVASVHNGYAMTLPLTVQMGDYKTTLDGPRKVPWADMDSSERRITPADPALVPPPVVSEPEPVKRRKTRVAPVKLLPEPPPKEPEPEPEPPPKVKRTKATTTEALDLWSLLEDT
jgi:hypothetical protein